MRNAPRTVSIESASSRLPLTFSHSRSASRIENRTGLATANPSCARSCCASPRISIERSSSRAASRFTSSRSKVGLPEVHEQLLGFRMDSQEPGETVPRRATELRGYLPVQLSRFPYGLKQVSKPVVERQCAIGSQSQDLLGVDSNRRRPSVTWLQYEKIGLRAGGTGSRTRIVSRRTACRSCRPAGVIRSEKLAQLVRFPELARRPRCCRWRLTTRRASPACRGADRVRSARPAFRRQRNDLRRRCRRTISGTTASRMAR